MRLEFPEDEKKYKWLSTLFNAYGIADEVNIDLFKDLAASGIYIACYKGCDSCCKQSSIPFTEPELLGISWFVSEKLSGPNRGLIKKQLRAHETTKRCPFLVDGVCSIYIVRPLACRQFFMAGKPCIDNVDAMNSRLNDIISPPKDGARKVAMKLLEYYDIFNPAEKVRAFNDGFILANSMQMHDCDWERLADQMDYFEHED